MSKFKFRLQKLLDIRKDMEEQSKLQFKKAQQEKDKVVNKLNSLKENYSKYRYEEKIEETTVEMIIRSNYLSALEKNIEDAGIELKDKIINVENKRKDLVAKQVERKTVETLKGKQKLRFENEMNLKEQKNNDELALYAFMRNR